MSERDTLPGRRSLLGRDPAARPARGARLLRRRCSAGSIVASGRGRVRSSPALRGRDVAGIGALPDRIAWARRGSRTCAWRAPTRPPSAATAAGGAAARRPVDAVSRRPLRRARRPDGGGVLRLGGRDPRGRRADQRARRLGDERAADDRPGDAPPSSTARSSAGRPRPTGRSSSCGCRAMSAARRTSRCRATSSPSWRRSATSARARAGTSTSGCRTPTRRSPRGRARRPRGGGAARPAAVPQRRAGRPRGRRLLDQPARLVARRSRRRVDVLLKDLGEAPEVLGHRAAHRRGCAAPSAWHPRRRPATCRSSPSGMAPAPCSSRGAHRGQARESRTCRPGGGRERRNEGKPRSDRERSRGLPFDGLDARVPGGRVLRIRRVGGDLRPRPSDRRLAVDVDGHG